MALGDKTTKTGLGDVTRDKSTLSGVPVEQKKIVTKRGLVAPSPIDPEQVEEFMPESDRTGRKSGVVDKSTNPGGMTPPPPLEELQIEARQVTPEAEAHRMRAESTRELRREVATDPIGLSAPDHETARKVAASEDITPGEGTDLKGDDSEDRSRFRTAPGGGMNRVSGGREQASAYVSPVTLKPGTGETPQTAPVKVLDVVENAVRAYQTEPSLLRRRASSLPPPIPEPKNRSYLLVGGIAIGLVIAALILWFAPTGPGSERAPEAGTSQPSGPTAEASAQKSKETRNEPAQGPKTDGKGENQAKAPETEKPDGAQRAPEALHEESTESGSQAKATRSETDPAVKKAPEAAQPKAAAPPAAKKPKPKSEDPKQKDLWLD